MPFQHIILFSLYASLFTVPPSPPTVIPLRQFDISFQVDFASAESLLEYFDWKQGNARRVAEQNGNLIAATTSGLLARTGSTTGQFIHTLEEMRGGARPAFDTYGLMPARQATEAIRTLLTEAKRRQLDRRIRGTLEGYFPADIALSATIPVYVVAMGNERAAAFVRRVVWADGLPRFVGQNEGEPVIVLNLARCLQEETLEGQFTSMLAVLAHECFHAVFMLYQEQSPMWQARHANPYPAWTLAELAHNEGIAYLLSMELSTGGRAPDRAWFSATEQAVQHLHSALRTMTNPATSPRRVQELMMDANLSGSFEGNYGATAGLRIAYEIETRLGRQALLETISGGTGLFLQRYQQIARGAGLPELSDELKAFFTSP